MKKIFALLLAIVMVMGLATVASATSGVDPIAPTPDAPKFTTDVQLKKLYTITGATNVVESADVDESVAVYPHETLNFTVVACDPIADSTKMIEVAPLEVKGPNGTMAITLPDYEKVGEYTYVIRETPGSAQGATYVTDADFITVKVLVSYAEGTQDLVAKLYLVQETASGNTQTSEIEVDDKKVAKVDTFINKYDVGHLEVKKTVEGNLASQTAEFNMTVTFKTEANKYVKSNITYVDSGEVKTIEAPAEGWTGTKSVPITLIHNETVKFYNIPEGVTYTVVESDTHKVADGEQANPNSAADKDYTASGEVTEFTDNNKIASQDEDKVTINNEKSTSVETGIVMDSVPFVVMAVIAVLGLAAFTAKKRVQE